MTFDMSGDAKPVSNSSKEETVNQFEVIVSGI